MTYGYEIENETTGDRSKKTNYHYYNPIYVKILYYLNQF